MKRFLAVLEPALILGLAVMIGGIVFSILLGVMGMSELVRLITRLPTDEGAGRGRPGPDSDERQAMRHPTRRAAIRGMTLIEILVVLVLIGIVLGIVGGNFIGRGEKAKADAAKIEIGQIAPGARPLQARGGPLPDDPGGSAGAGERADGHRELERAVLEEGRAAEGPVEQRVPLRSPAQGAPFEIVSLGSDGKEGGEGVEKDISSLR